MTNQAIAATFITAGILGLVNPRGGWVFLGTAAIVYLTLGWMPFTSVSP